MRKWNDFESEMAVVEERCSAAFSLPSMPLIQPQTSETRVSTRQRTEGDMNPSTKLHKFGQTWHRPMALTGNGFATRVTTTYFRNLVSTI